MGRSKIWILTAVFLPLTSHAKIDYCPDGANQIVVPYLPAPDTPEGEKAIINKILEIFDSLETVDTETKNLFKKGTIKIKTYESSKDKESAKKGKPIQRAFFRSSDESIHINLAHFYKEKIALEDSLDPKELPYYQALLTVPIFAHEAKHALDYIRLKNILGSGLPEVGPLKEKEIVALAAGLVAASELTALYPRIFDLYFEITNEDSAMLKLLNPFLMEGPSALWDYLDRVPTYINFPTLNERQRSNPLPQIQFDTLKKYYDQELLKVDQIWQELKSLNEECGGNFIAPSSRYGKEN